MITYFEGKNHKPDKKYRIYKTLNKILKSIDSIVIIGATSTSIFSSLTGVGSNILPTSAGIACTLTLGDKVLHKMIINK